MQSLKKSIKSVLPNSKLINISGIDILLIRKDIKNINFSVRSTDASISISVPRNISEDKLLLIISSKLPWIRKKIKAVKNLPAPIKKSIISGENHYFLGKPYKLEIVEQSGKPEITLETYGRMKMFVRPNTLQLNRERLLNEWYRAELKKRIPILIEKWQPIIGKKVSMWNIKRMKTRWGTCNILKKRIWLNLDLAKQSEDCLEYVLVHEMTHLLEPTHSPRFRNLLDGFMPGWQRIEELLNPVNKNRELHEI